MPPYVSMYYIIAYTTAYTSAAPTPTTQPTYTPWPTYTPRPISATYTPEPTYTPWPTYTPEPTYTPNPAAPTYTPQPTYTPVSGGSQIVCPQFPSSPIIDDFNRPDEGPPPGELWYTPDGAQGFEVYSNAIRGDDEAVEFSFSSFSTETIVTDAEVFMTVTEFEGTQEVYIGIVNLIDNSGYVLASTSDGLLLQGSGGVMAEDSTPLEDGGSIGMQIISNTVHAFYKPPVGEWAEVFSASDDQNLTEGRIWFGAYTNTIIIDNVGGGHITCQSPTAMATPDAYTHTLDSGHTVYLPITMSFGQIYTSILAIPVVLVLLSLVMIRVFR